MTTYWCEHAWLSGGAAASVRVAVADGRISGVAAGAAPAPGDVRLGGLVLPGLANGHSHAFHRALRGRTPGGGSFWAWRGQMYALAGRLTPDDYLALARAVYAEMALAGTTCVGEFHYLHHGAGGTPYADPNAMGEALVQAAAEAGVRLTLLDTCYLSAGPGGGELDPVQQRFSDGDPDRWAARVERLRERPGLRIGAAVHSVRAVPREHLTTVAAAARGRPLHVHVSEQPAENDTCRSVHGATPTTVLAEEGVLGPGTTAVHAIHLTADDVATLAGSGTAVCACPSTEADLGDGIGPFRQLADAGCALLLGSDSHAVVDPFAEVRLLEGHERLRSGERGRFSAAELVAALTGHDALGWPDAGRTEVGARADLVAVDLASPRTAGTAPDQAVLAAAASDVRTVVVDGRVVVDQGRHRLGDVGRLLAEAVAPLWAAR
ncbi:formimidoylglutamate deiminase [Geodermatophilus sp. YIM 151500]|uniref:formimidoylglutamate deiminase n=1 Tax=Geodermatophilus sp. YIM 151500 TaxID=2984531 RepID=UPI0021E4D96B|nr:formimidoylglutamate deiminase [Geodermatophilus sp. YIM 151500]MCV2487852.1 formimidoylglutamate deiminase [Geodermatophilus sp. YIM 151500]